MESAKTHVRHRWSQEELALLKKLWESGAPSDEIAKIFGLKYSSIKKQAHKHGFKRPIRWSQEEIEILKKYYSTLPKNKLMQLLPKRSWVAIQSKAEKELGLRKSLLANKEPVDFSFLSESEKGYIAGLIDGEGTITLEKRKFASDIKVHPAVYISNTSLELLTHIREVLGVGTIRRGHRRKSRSTGSERKQDYKLGIHKIREVEGLLKTIKPYLVLKKRQAEVVLEFIQRLLSKTERNYKLSKDELALLAKIRMLNKRG